MGAFYDYRCPRCGARVSHDRDEGPWEGRLRVECSVHLRPSLWFAITSPRGGS